MPREYWAEIFEALTPSQADPRPCAWRESGRMIIRQLDLKRPIYQETANYGHFGRASFPREKTDKAADLQKEVG